MIVVKLERSYTSPAAEPFRDGNACNVSEVNNYMYIIDFFNCGRMCSCRGLGSLWTSDQYEAVAGTLVALHTFTFCTESSEVRLSTTPSNEAEEGLHLIS